MKIARVRTNIGWIDRFPYIPSETNFKRQGSTAARLNSCSNPIQLARTKRTMTVAVLPLKSQDLQHSRQISMAVSREALKYGQSAGYAIIRSEVKFKVVIYFAKRAG